MLLKFSKFCDTSSYSDKSALFRTGLSRFLFILNGGTPPDKSRSFCEFYNWLISSLTILKSYASADLYVELFSMLWTVWKSPDMWETYLESCLDVFEFTIYLDPAAL